MKTPAVLVMMVLAAGCAQTVTPNYDARFGDAVRSARLAMSVDPGAGERGDAARGIDGRAAQESMKRYQKSFAEPPPASNVINIGGQIGGDSNGANGGAGR